MKSLEVALAKAAIARDALLLDEMLDRLEESERQFRLTAAFQRYPNDPPAVVFDHIAWED
jgi:hypothetical protein